MEEDDGGDEFGSGEIHKSFEEMENVYDKLLILNYEAEFLILTKLPPLHRLYFIVPTNPGEQFFNFVSLCSWLIQKCERTIPMPHEAEDPNTVICRILEVVRDMGAILDFSPSRVKSGCGSDVVSVLDFLTDKAILKVGHEWESPIMPTALDTLFEDEHQHQVITLDKVMDEALDPLSSDEGGDENDAKTFPDVPGYEIEGKKILQSDTSHEQWQLELESVLPELKLTIKSDNFDWRWRLSQMRNYADKIQRAGAEIDGPISKIISEAETVTAAVRNRENYLSNQFVGRLDDLNEVEMEILAIKEKYGEQEWELKNQNRLLASTEEKIRECQKQLDERSSLISDGAPIAEARKTLAALKNDIATMDTEIAVKRNCEFRNKYEPSDG